jgi:hypothetical protein
MNRTDFRWLNFLILMAVASACAADDASAPDSEAGWTIDPEPLLVIRDDDPDDPVPMVEVTSATLLPTDEIVVTDRFGPAIHVFNLDGEVVRSPGQRGEGPGEYLAPSLVTTCGTDSLFVFDYNRRLVLVMDFEGALIREFRPVNRPDTIKCLTDSTFLVLDLPDEYPPLSGDGTRGYATVWVSDHQGQELFRVGSFPHVEHRVMGRNADIAGVGGRIVVGTADSAMVEVYGEGGEPLGTLPIGQSPRAPTPEEYERELEFWLTPARGDPERRDILRSRYDQVPPPDEVYPYRELLGDPHGVLWAVASVLGAETTRLQAVDSTGTLRANFTVPNGFEPLEIGEDYMIGRQVAEDLSQELVMYRLLRSP